MNVGDLVSYEDTLYYVLIHEVDFIMCDVADTPLDVDDDQLWVAACIYCDDAEPGDEDWSYAPSFVVVRESVLVAESCVA